MNSKPSNNYRYERKYQVDQLDDHQARAIVKLHPAMFIQPYPPRFVNNIYFDTQAMDNYFDNVRGVGDRRKVRIRWYADLFGQIDNPILEFKIKQGLVGTKEQYPLNPFFLDRGFSSRQCRDVLHSESLPDHAQVYVRDLTAVLINRYYRWYFATVDGKYRVTVDTHMEFYHVSGLRSSFAHRQEDYTNVVVELKYQPEHERLAHRISSYFPFRVTKNSKYVQGIERVYL